MSGALRAAAGVADPLLASRLLSRLPLETFDAEAASLFEPLLGQFGLQWGEDVLSALAPPHDDVRRKWLATLPRVCEELSAAGDDGWALARWLAASQWEWIEAAMREAENEPSPTRAGARSNALAAAAAAVLRSIALIGAFDLGEAIVAQLASTRTERRVDFLMAVLRATAERDDHVALALRAARELCIDSLTARLSAAPRDAGDWSILFEPPCRCERCRKLGAFLVSREQRVLEWPLAKEHRAHVHRTVEEYELPLDHRTRRTGRPYTLVLTKRETMFGQDAARRKQWLDDLTWLKDVRR